MAMVVFPCAGEGRSAMSTNSTEYHVLDAWFAGFLDGEGCIRIAIADRERYTTGFELAPIVRITHEQLTGLLDAEDWIGVTMRPEDGYKVNHCPQPQVEISQSSQDRLMDALCAHCDARDINCFVTTIKYDDNRADQYVWGVQGVSTTRELLTPLRDQFIVKREQVDIFLD